MEAVDDHHEEGEDQPARVALDRPDIRPTVIVSLDEVAWEASQDCFFNLAWRQRDLDPVLTDYVQLRDKTAIPAESLRDKLEELISTASEGTLNATRFRHQYYLPQEQDNVNKSRLEFLNTHLRTFANRLKLEVETACGHMINREFRKELVNPCIIVNATAWIPAAQALFWLMPELAYIQLPPPFRIIGVLRGTDYSKPERDDPLEIRRLERETRLLSLLSEGELIWNEGQLPTWTEKLRHSLGALHHTENLPRPYDRVFFLDARKDHGKFPLRIKSNSGESDAQVSRLLEVLSASSLDAQLEQLIAATDHGTRPFNLCGYGCFCVETSNLGSKRRNQELAELLDSNYLQLSKVDQKPRDLARACRKETAGAFRAELQALFDRMVVEGKNSNLGDTRIFPCGWWGRRWCEIGHGFKVLWAGLLGRRLRPRLTIPLKKGLELLPRIPHGILEAPDPIFDRDAEQTEQQLRDEVWTFHAFVTEEFVEALDRGEVETLKRVGEHTRMIAESQPKQMQATVNHLEGVLGEIRHLPAKLLERKKRLTENSRRFHKRKHLMEGNLRPWFDARHVARPMLHVAPRILAVLLRGVFLALALWHLITFVDGFQDTAGAITGNALVAKLKLLGLPVVMGIVGGVCLVCLAVLAAIRLIVARTRSVMGWVFARELNSRVLDSGARAYQHIIKGLKEDLNELKSVQTEFHEEKQRLESDKIPPLGDYFRVEVESEDREHEEEIKERIKAVGPELPPVLGGQRRVQRDILHYHEDATDRLGKALKHAGRHVDMVYKNFLLEKPVEEAMQERFQDKPAKLRTLAYDAIDGSAPWLAGNGSSPAPSRWFFSEVENGLLEEQTRKLGESVTLCDSKDPSRQILVQIGAPAGLLHGMDLHRTGELARAVRLLPRKNRPVAVLAETKEFIHRHFTVDWEKEVETVAAPDSGGDVGDSDRQATPQARSHNLLSALKSIYVSGLTKFVNEYDGDSSGPVVMKCVDELDQGRANLEAEITEFFDETDAHQVEHLVRFLKPVDDAIHRLSGTGENQAALDDLTEIRAQVDPLLEQHGIERVDPEVDSIYDSRLHGPCTPKVPKEVLEQAPDEIKIEEVLQRGYHWKKTPPGTGLRRIVDSLVRVSFPDPETIEEVAAPQEVVDEADEAEEFLEGAIEPGAEEPPAEASFAEPETGDESLGPESVEKSEGPLSEKETEDSLQVAGQSQPEERPEIAKQPEAEPGESKPEDQAQAPPGHFQAPKSVEPESQLPKPNPEEPLSESSDEDHE